MRCFFILVFLLKKRKVSCKIRPYKEVVNKLKYVKYLNSKIGKIGIVEENGQIIRILWDKDTKEEVIQKDTKLLEEASKQIEEYLDGKRTKFELPLKLNGTEFMKKVWKALQEIPYGETRTYKQIAEKIGNPKAVRAVGMANNKNKIPIIIPCHRVIGSNGKLIGYALGLDKKQWLLDLEKNNEKEELF